MVYRSDYIDVTSPTYRSKGPDDRAYNLRGKPLQLTFPVRSENAPPDDPREVLTQLVQAHAAARLPGCFEVRAVEDEYDIVGVAAADENGTVIPYVPLLDTRVSIANKDWTLTALFNEICKELSMRRHTTVRLGDFPVNAFGQIHFEGGFDGVPAREAIRSALRKTPWTYAWTLIYRYRLNSYLLHFELVADN